MKPKYTYTNAADIPPALKDFYTEKDGKWTIDIDGAASIERVTEFRDKNIALQKENTDLKATWDGFSKDEVAALIEKKAEIEGAKVKNDGEFQVKLKERTDAMKLDYEKKLADLQKVSDRQSVQLSEVIIDKHLIEEATKLGLRPEAAEDLLNRGRSVFKLKDGKPVAFNKDGAEIYDTDASPLQPANWIKGLAKSAPFLFVESAGGGSQGGAGGGGGKTVTVTGNPWKQGAEYNMTKQGEMFKANPAEARRLAAEAGTPIPVTPA